MAESTLSFSDVVIGAMWAAQSRGAEYFPLLDDPSWHLFFNAVYQNLREKLPPSFRLDIDDSGTYPRVTELMRDKLVRRDLAMCAEINMEANRMRLKPDAWGSDFVCDYPVVADEMFLIARAIFRF